MSGISGFNWNDKNLINKMLLTLNHRGPDNALLFLDDALSLGNNIITRNKALERRNQIIHNENESIWIVFDGEIFNSCSIRKLLEQKKHRFYTDNVEEVVIHAYEEYGHQCLLKFNGQFAFCIYDKNKSELFLARDPCGIVPLYYFHKSNRFIFASEIKALLNHDLIKKVNKKALREFFTFRFTIAPNTIIEDVSKLEHSHYMIFNLKKNQKKIVKYFDFVNEISKKRLKEDICPQVFKLLNNSVKIRSTGGKPICCFLSGGIDSSIITGLASKYNRELNTYSAGFESQSELKYAKIVSDHFNTIHHEIIVSNEDCFNNIDKMVYHMDEPIGDAAFIPTLILSEHVNQQFNIVLTGDGGDEAFGGYDKYKMYYYGRALSHFFPKFNYRQEILYRISKFSLLDEKNGYIETIRAFSDDEMNRLKIEPKIENRFWLKTGDIFQKMQYFDLNTSVPEDFCMKADKMSMAYSLEQRAPFSDVRLISLAINIPINLKIRFWNEKFLLKQTFRNLLPKIIVQRRKRGYSAPMDVWLKTILKSRFLELLKENNHQLYDKSLAFDLFSRMCNSGTNYKRIFLLAQKLWSIFIFEEWYKLFIKDFK